MVVLSGRQPDVLNSPSSCDLCFFRPSDSVGLFLFRFFTRIRAFDLGAVVQAAFSPMPLLFLLPSFPSV